MTTETLNISEAQLVDYSQSQNEPSWMTELRKEAFKQAESLEMPKPDKTKLNKWDFDSFKQHETQGAVFHDLKELPSEIDRIINVENTENLVIQHNNTSAYTKVNDKALQDGVIIEHISEALINHSDLSLIHISEPTRPY